MRPSSWFTRLRDVKRVERSIQEDVMYSSNMLRHGDEGPSTPFVKSRSVPATEARPGKCPSECGDGGSRPSMISNTRPGEPDPIGSVKSLSVPVTNCTANKGAFWRQSSHESRDEGSRPSMTKNVRPGEDTDPSDDHMMGSFMLFLRSAPKDHNSLSVSSCNCLSNALFEAEKLEAYQKEHGLCNNNMEECVTTSDTSSSFCSETSFKNSTLSSKSSWQDGGRPEEHNKVWQDVDSLKRLLSPGTSDSNTDGSSCTPNVYSGMNHKSSSSSNCATKSISIVYHEIARDRPRLLSRAWIRRRVQSLWNSNLDAGREGSANSWWTKGHIEKTSSNIMDEEKGSCDEQDFSLATSFTHNMQGDMNGLCNDNVREHPWQLGRVLGNHHDVARNNRQLKIKSSSCARMRTFGKQLHQGTTKHNSQVQYHTRPQRRRCVSMSAMLPPDLQGVVGDSTALVKISENPYKDFRESIYEMIMEKDLEGPRDVEELLYCYLALNSPKHYELIEEVFSDVWSSILMSAR